MTTTLLTTLTTTRLDQDDNHNDDNYHDDHHKTLLSSPRRRRKAGFRLFLFIQVSDTRLAAISAAHYSILAVRRFSPGFSGRSFSFVGCHLPWGTYLLGGANSGRPPPKKKKGPKTGPKMGPKMGPKI